MLLPTGTLLCLLFVTLSTVDASPLNRHSGKTALRFATKLDDHGILNIVEIDRARAQALKQVGQLGKRNPSFSATNTAMNYVADVGVGSPPITYSLLVDTGSASTFVGANKSYVQTSTSKDTGNPASASYGSANWYGEEWIDTVTLSPQLVIHNQSIGVASSSRGFNGTDGILGVGPATSNMVGSTNLIPTVSDNLYAQKTVSEEVLGVYFVPISNGNTGELTFGGYDHRAVTSPVSYVPLTKTSPASTFWGIDQSVAYGKETILSSTAGIVDTGTTLTLLATDAYQKYQKLTGATMDEATGLLRITLDQYATLQPLTFKIGDKPYALTPNGQIWPRSLNTRIGGNEAAIYLVVSNIGSYSGSGLDFVNGFTFLERFYGVFDTTHGRVGFATTAYTQSTSN